MKVCTLSIQVPKWKEGYCAVCYEKPAVDCVFLTAYEDKLYCTGPLERRKGECKSCPERVCKECMIEVLES